MRIDVVTVFPDYLAPLGLSLVGKSVGSGLVDLRVHDLRDFAHDRHRTVDDSPSGGGPGMVMKPEPWGEALDHVLAEAAIGTRIVVPSPSGRLFRQETAREYAELPGLVFACGRYEGIDDRVWRHYERQWPVDEVSLGDYVLAGGEVAALAIIEATVRLLPGVLGNPGSASDDSFGPDRVAGPLEGPAYTKPRSWRGLDVPDVLLSGDHEAIRAWREDQSRRRTELLRPDLA
ncbi:MAG: tRNA (guanosine(37)-N1)-methyltransferase TrmD [Candidatus Nanopelagicales bacterium]|nr:tRNA (guanosine(37)-N1)-methyltransferase TrmD [Candidatus Nanopelagicales bacterium]MDZ4248487.1 tRNA (guanosine(37)-N1)-methyltransferase TrmD [Candidatus Nanopelagicales bacterium]